MTRRTPRSPPRGSARARRHARELSATQPQLPRFRGRGNRFHGWWRGGRVCRGRACGRMTPALSPALATLDATSGFRPRSTGPAVPPMNAGYTSVRITRVSGRTPSNFIASAPASDCMSSCQAAMSGISAISPTRFEPSGHGTCESLFPAAPRPPLASVNSVNRRRRPPREMQSTWACALPSHRERCAQLY